MHQGFTSSEAAERILACLVDQSDDAIITTDLDATIRSWNHGATRLYGYTPDEAIGRPLFLLLPEGQTDVMRANYARVRDGHRIEQFETLRRGKDGHLIEVSQTLSPIRSDAGIVIAALSVARDIRGQKRSDAALSASEARWRAVVQSAVDGIVMINARGRIEAFNPAAERLFGYAESEVIGRNISMLMPSPYREEHDGYLSRYLREGDARVIGIGREVTGLRKDGSTFPVHLAVGEMQVSGERKFTGILHDLTARVEIEERLREQASLARLGEMAAVIAHEVKNPLAGIRGAIQVIGGRLPADSAEAGVTREIVSRIDALGDLMKDLLLFARPPQPHPVQVDIATLVSSTAELLTADPALSGVSVEVLGAAPPLLADGGLLRIVFLNLLVNGAQAMKGRGTLQVDVSADSQGCAIAFRDSGPGIPPDVREKVFTPFFTTKARGTGLGLATAKRLVEAHRGNITVDCPPDGGTTVTVRLPTQS